MPWQPTLDAYDPSQVGSGVLPPPGGDPKLIASYVDQLILESTQDEQRLAWEIEAEQGINLYLGNHWEEAKQNDGWIRVVLNRIQNCIIAVMAVQAADPPRITFSPRETGEPPQVFLNLKHPVGQRLAAELAQVSMGSDTPFDPNEPLPDAIATAIRQDVQSGQLINQQAQATGQSVPAGVVPADAIIEINEQTIADAIQTIFDGIWEAAGLQLIYAENVLNKNVLGFQPTLYEFDDLITKLPIVTNVHPVHVFLDPIKSHIRQCQYAIYDQPLGAAEAKALYPQFSAKIDEAAATGPLRYPGTRPYYPGYRYTQPFYRPMVVVRNCWLRNQQYPLSPQEAVASGRLVQGQLPTGNTISAPDMATGEIQQLQETRDALLHPATGEEVTPTIADPTTGNPRPNPAWPVAYKIRQIRIVLDEVVEDKACECPDIPLPCNINVPRPLSPYGQGEPARLKGIQTAINRLLSSAITNQAYTALPPEWIDKAIADRLSDATQREMRTRPGQRIQIPHDLLQSVGADIRKLFGTIDPPQLPADFWKLLNLLLQLIDKEGNLADVLQGNASAGWSGNAIESLQNAASQILRAKSMMTEYWLKDLAKLIIWDARFRLTPEDWGTWCRKYPPQAIAAIYNRFRPAECVVSISIASGSGAAKNQETQNLIAARNSGVPIAPQELMERLNLDPDVQMQKSAEWARATAAMQPAAMPPPGAAPMVPGRPVPPAPPVANNAAP